MTLKLQHTKARPGFQYEGIEQEEVTGFKEGIRGRGDVKGAHENGANQVCLQCKSS